MSASEKLRALDLSPWVEDMQGVNDYWAAQEALRKILPQIVALVEAAEAKFDGKSYETGIPTYIGKDALYDALCFLNEKLI